MKYIQWLFVFVLVLVYKNDLIAQRFWIAPSSSNWSNQANWSATSGGPGGATIPTSSTLVHFDANGSGNCVFDVSANVDGISMEGYSGTLDLNGFSMTTTGTNLFESGVVINSQAAPASIIIDTGSSTAFSGTFFNVPITGSSGRIFFHGSQFGSSLSIVKTSIDTDNSFGGNVFNGTVTMTTTSGRISLGNGNADHFNGLATFNNFGTSRFYVANDHAGQTTTFGAEVTLNSNKADDSDAWSFLIAENAGSSVAFNGNMTLNCEGNARSTCRFLEGTGSTAMFLGNVTINVTNANSSTFIRMGASGTSTYNGNIIVNNSNGAGGVLFNTAVGSGSSLAASRTIAIAGNFNSGTLQVSRFHQVGSTNQALTLSGTSVLVLGPSTQIEGNASFTAPGLQLESCTFGGSAYLEKTGSSIDNSIGSNTFNGPALMVNNGSGEFNLANTSPDIFNSGLTLTNSSTSRIQLGIDAPGTVVNGELIINHNGNSNSTGGSTIIARNAGSSVTINGTLRANNANTGTSGIIIGYSGNVTVAGNIVFTSTGGGGVTLGATSNAVVNQSSGYSVSNNSFSAGNLIVSRLTQAGTSSNTLVLTGSARLFIGPFSSFGGSVNFTAPGILLNGALFQGGAILLKTGSTDDAGSGGNVFSSSASLSNQGTGYFLTGNSSPDTFHGSLTLNNLSTGSIRLAHNVPGTQFNGNIELNSTAGGGIYFSANSTGASTLASPRQISIGPTGFSAGELVLRRMDIQQSNPNILHLTGSAILRIGSMTIQGNLDLRAPQIYADGLHVMGTASLEKTSSGDDNNAGGNIFDGPVTFSNSGTGIFRLGFSAADSFAGNVTFNQLSGLIQPCYNYDAAFFANVITNGTSPVVFGTGSGTATFTGNTNQTISRTGTANPTIRRLILSKTAGDVTLSTTVNITVASTFSSGVVHTSPTSLMIFSDNSTTTGASQLSYIDGPVRKVGDDAFTFPTGDAGFFRPVVISAPTNVSNFFTAEYFKSAQPFGQNASSTVTTLSNCEFWTLTRNSGGPNIDVTLPWVSTDCVTPYSSTLADFRVMRWNGAQWINEGNNSTTGTGTIGTITASVSVNTASTLTLGFNNVGQALPISISKFYAQRTLTGVNLQWSTASEFNNHNFTVQRSGDGKVFQDLGLVNGQGTSSRINHYTFFDSAAPLARIYYRLKQTDFDGKFTLSDLISVSYDAPLTLSLYPNPTTVGSTVHLSAPVDCQVLNNKGTVVLSFSNGQQIDTSALSPGLYLIKTTFDHNLHRLIVE